MKFELLQNGGKITYFNVWMRYDFIRKHLFNKCIYALSSEYDSDKLFAINMARRFSENF